MIMGASSVGKYAGIGGQVRQRLGGYRDVLEPLVPRSLNAHALPSRSDAAIARQPLDAPTQVLVRPKRAVRGSRQWKSRSRSCSDRYRIYTGNVAATCPPALKNGRLSLFIPEMSR